jgi:hypothetical protein
MSRDSSQVVAVVDIGTINGHRVQGITARATIIVDGRQAILCSPLEYQLALLVLQTTPGVSLAASPLLSAMAVDRRSLGDLMTALRKKVCAPLGLTIVSIPRYGYMLVADAPQTKKR